MKVGACDKITQSGVCVAKSKAGDGREATTMADRGRTTTAGDQKGDHFLYQSNHPQVRVVYELKRKNKTPANRVVVTHD